MRQSLFLRLRPFLRRDLRGRLISAVFAVVGLLSLSWLGVSALTGSASRDAHSLRVALGLEHHNQVCTVWRAEGEPSQQPECVYDDARQEQLHEQFVADQEFRLAVYEELSRRVTNGLEAVHEAEAILDSLRASSSRTAQHPDPGEETAAERNAKVVHQAWRIAAAGASVDLRPALHSPAFPIGGHLQFPPEQYNAQTLQAELESAKFRLREVARELDELRVREVGHAYSGGGIGSAFTIEELVLADDDRATDLAWWLAGTTSSALSFDQDADEAIDRTLLRTAEQNPHQLLAAIVNPEADIWLGAWTSSDLDPIHEPTVRYRSPVTTTQKLRLFGATLLLLAGFMLTVVGPVVAATNTAREREAGTLPVLRMTGLSASDLSAAMMLGPNVFAIATSVALLSIGLPILMFTAGLSALIVSIAVVAILAAAIHIIAVALGDALGQRVNALVVGGLFATVLVLPGFIGTLLVLTDATATGMLLGPLPAVVTVTAGLSGLPFAELAAAGGAGEFGTSIFSYSLVAHAALAFVCVGSWRRRVEQAWSALFRPAEGVLLSIVAVGCGTFVVLDLCERVNVRSYDQVNAITFVASLFLLPVLGWLLYSSLVRPARASAVAEVTSVRAAFLRFQGFLAIAALALGGAYGLVLERSGFDHGHELMWATLATGLLAVETAVATILLSARKRSGRHRVLILGALVVAAQLGAALGVYQIESLFISSTNSPANPLLIGMDASPYWLILLVLLWATGLGLILAAVLRERDRGEVERTDNEEEENGKRSRVLH